jgi:hypothetical protein
MKPTFLIAGCGKCGTTTLAHLLDQHPDVFITQPKEPNFFSYDAIYAQGWEWYESLYEKGRDQVARGDASVSYSMEEYETAVCERISGYVPDVRVIYIARNPFKRLESVYREHHDSGHQKGWHLPHSLEKAVEYRPQMVINSLYWQRTAPFRSNLGEKQVLYLCLEDLQNNPSEALKLCFEFIGVDPTIGIPDPRIQLNEGSKKMYDTKLMRAIRTYYVANRLYQELPERIKGAILPLLRRPFGDRIIDWEPGFRQEFVEWMAGDVRGFLEACGKAADFWGKEFAGGD